MIRDEGKTGGPSEGAPEREPRPAAPRKRALRGRRLALWIYYGMGFALAVAATVQISRQSFVHAPAGAPYADCREGLRALAAAVERARRAASGSDGEDAALARFRAALAPDWAFREEVARSCSDRKSAGALDAIERLRYAEEHAVRLEAGELAPLRRRVQAILEHELGARAPEGARAAGPEGPGPWPTTPRPRDSTP